MDQFILGSFGVSSIEVMALGKPVLCYIMDQVEINLPEACPIINANLDNLESKLEQLILKYKGIHNPFICGGSKDTGDDGLPNMIFVAPAMGADGFAIYQKVKDYSAPSY